MSDDGSVADDAELADAVARMRGMHERPRHELVRFAFLRLLGLVYAFAFLGATQQLPALIGEHGLLPAADHLDRARAVYGGTGWAFLERPTLFFAGVSDAGLVIVAWLGLALSIAVLAGATNAALMLVLWGLHLSIVHVGQTFYGYGWEILLLEAGWLAVFLCPLRSLSPLPREETPRLLVWLLRWLCFRVMFGAGLIKMRGDPCWEELTCLSFHYETQPLPNPLSALFHHTPPWFHTIEVVVNHVVELIVPFFLFGPRQLRYAGGFLIIGFQLVLILSGNLSFLNWLTIAIAVAAFDDRLLSRVIPRRWTLPPTLEPSKLRRGVVWACFAVVLFLSVNPVMNMLSWDQAMNTSFDRLHLVNTYGAFGSVNRVRREIVLEGTAGDPDDPRARWLAYELPCKPGDPMRRPCLRAPYHHRLDWQMWFAAMRDYEHEPWIVHLVHKLLRGERTVKTLLSHDPFPRRPPRAIRATLYRYELTSPSERGFWRRERIGEYMRPLTRDDPELRAFLEAYGWR